MKHYFVEAISKDVQLIAAITFFIVASAFGIGAVFGNNWNECPAIEDTK